MIFTRSLFEKLYNLAEEQKVEGLPTFENFNLLEDRKCEVNDCPTRDISNLLWEVRDDKRFTREVQRLQIAIGDARIITDKEIRRLTRPGSGGEHLKKLYDFKMNGMKYIYNFYMEENPCQTQSRVQPGQEKNLGTVSVQRSKKVSQSKR